MYVIRRKDTDQYYCGGGGEVMHDRWSPSIDEAVLFEKIHTILRTVVSSPILVQNVKWMTVDKIQINRQEMQRGV